MRFHRLLSTCAFLALCFAARGEELVSVRGSNVVARALAEAVPALQKEHDIRLNYVHEINGLEITDKLAQDVFDFALFTRPLTGKERALHPEKKYFETLIGKQAVLVVVPDQVWRSGVRALTKEQLRQIYEQEVKNWKELGGEDREIVYYNREAGHGIWDLFMIFLYEDVRRAPLSKAEKLTNPDDVRTSVEFNGGAISLLEHGSLGGGRLHALGIKLEDGTVVDPSPENIASGRYPISRPLYLVTSKVPTGKLRRVLEFMLSDAGQECVKKAGHVPLAVLGLKK